MLQFKRVRVLPMVASGVFERALEEYERAPPAERHAFIAKIVRQCSVRELSQLETLILPRLKVDFLGRVPRELALHILSYVGDPRILARAACVSKSWNHLVTNELLWANMCAVYGYNTHTTWNWIESLIPRASSSVERAAGTACDTPHYPTAPPRTPRSGRTLNLKRPFPSPAQALTSPSRPPPPSKQRREDAYETQSLSSALPIARERADAISFRSLFKLAYRTGAIRTRLWH